MKVFFPPFSLLMEKMIEKIEFESEANTFNKQRQLRDDTHKVLQK